MSEEVLKNALELLYIAEFGEFADAPRFKTTLKHDLAMKRIFRLYKKNTAYLRNNNTSAVPRTSRARLKLNRKIAVIIAIFIFLAALSGCVAAYFISKAFRGEVHDKYTKMFAIDLENCPETIEDEYFISELPNGYDIFFKDSSIIDVYTEYVNSDGELMVLSQYVKKNYHPQYDNEHGNFEEVDINGRNGLILDYSDFEKTFCALFWDNDDYILEITAFLPKNETLKLARSVKISEVSNKSRA